MKIKLFQINKNLQDVWMRWHQGTLGSTTITVRLWYSLFSEPWSLSSSTGFELHFSHCKSLGFKLLKCCSQRKGTTGLAVNMVKPCLYTDCLICVYAVRIPFYPGLFKSLCGWYPSSWTCRNTPILMSSFIFCNSKTFKGD